MPQPKGTKRKATPGSVAKRGRPTKYTEDLCYRLLVAYYTQLAGEVFVPTYEGTGSGRRLAVGVHRPSKSRDASRYAAFRNSLDGRIDSLLDKFDTTILTMARRKVPIERMPLFVRIDWSRISIAELLSVGVDPTRPIGEQTTDFAEATWLFQTYQDIGRKARTKPRTLR